MEPEAQAVATGEGDWGDRKHQTSVIDKLVIQMGNSLYLYLWCQVSIISIFSILDL